MRSAASHGPQTSHSVSAQTSGSCVCLGVKSARLGSAVSQCVCVCVCVCACVCVFTAPLTQLCIMTLLGTVEKFKSTFADARDFTPARTSEPCFTIHHYAGDVTYHTDGFLERNKDELPGDVLGLCFSSNVALIHQMFDNSSKVLVASSSWWICVSVCALGFGLRILLLVSEFSVLGFWGRCRSLTCLARGP